LASSQEISFGLWHSFADPFDVLILVPLALYIIAKYLWEKSNRLDALGEYVDGYPMDRYEKGTAVDLDTPKLGYFLPADLTKASKIANAALSRTPQFHHFQSHYVTSTDSILIMINVPVFKIELKPQ
jgi:hypothetical protein